MKTLGKKAEKFADDLSYSNKGLIPVVVCDASNNQLLMLAYANREAVARTLVSGRAYFFSRSRKALWNKGETSGNVMDIVSVRTDCDKDALQYLVEVRGEGNACHTGRKSCFGDQQFTFFDLEKLVKQRKKKSPKGSYTAKLINDRKMRSAKIVEEALELAEVYLDKDGRKRVVEEAADLVYHLLVSLVAENISLKDVERELEKRRKMSKRR